MTPTGSREVREMVKVGVERVKEERVGEGGEKREEREG